MSGRADESHTAFPTFPRTVVGIFLIVTMALLMGLGWHLRGFHENRETTCLSIGLAVAAVVTTLWVWLYVFRLVRSREEDRHRVQTLRRSEELLRVSRDELEEVNRRLRENQHSLIQSEKMASIGQIAAGIAHEINNPVGFVMSNLGTLHAYIEFFKGLLDLYGQLAERVRRENADVHRDLLDRVDETLAHDDLSFIFEDIDHLLDESVDGAERIRDIVLSLRTFARPDEGEVKEADVNDCIETTLKIVWNELKHKCRVEKKLARLPLVRCNPAQLSQVFLNLLVNAAHAITDHGEIRIETEQVDGRVVIRVGDTGCGIRVEDLSRIFDPFFTTKDVGHGTGLGLSISQGIIRSHGGTIEVESEVGKGTTFTITLPVEGSSDE